jgi:hypothetical protein
MARLKISNNNSFLIFNPFTSGQRATSYRRRPGGTGDRGFTNVMENVSDKCIHKCHHPILAKQPIPPPPPSLMAHNGVRL